MTPSPRVLTTRTSASRSRKTVDPGFLTRDAIDDLDALPPRLAEDVASTIDSLRLDPEMVGKQLRGRLSGLWVARVGSYRVLYTIEGPSRRGARVIVRAVRHRSVAYRTRR